MENSVHFGPLTEIRMVENRAFVGKVKLHENSLTCRHLLQICPLRLSCVSSSSSPSPPSTSARLSRTSASSLPAPSSRMLRVNNISAVSESVTLSPSKAGGGVPTFETTKTSAFSTYTQLRFASVVLDGVLRSLHTRGCSWEATH